jgi:acyl-coenzyme A synthetase/AMP-(fatty) acid ligase
MAQSRKQPPGRLLEAVCRRVRNDPRGTAVITEKRVVTHAELWREAAAMAAWLTRQGLGRGDVVGISIREEYRNLLATLGAMQAGLGQVVLPTHDPATARADIARRLKVAAVLADRIGDGLDNFPVLVPDFSIAGTARGCDDLADIDDAYADEECFYLSSSGTTGRAKIVPLNQRQLLAQAKNAQLKKRREVLYRPGSIEFNNSRRHRLYCLATGGINVLMRPERMSALEICHRFGVTLLELSAAQASSLLDATGGERPPHDLELQIRGSPVSADLRRRIVHHLTRRLVIGYGATEFGSIATTEPADLENPALLGTVHPAIALEIVDDKDRALPPDQSGRIRIRGAGMATHYHDDDEATRHGFRDGWFYPGDMGHFTQDGALCFDGRGDDMMMLASINIFPSEIESIGEVLPGVTECAAFSIKSGEFGDVPLLAVISDGTTTPEAVLAAMKRALGVRAPRRVIFVDELPRSAEGKVQRMELRKLVQQRAAA